MPDLAYTKQTPDIAARRWRLVKPSFNRCQASAWLGIAQPYNIPDVERCRMWREVPRQRHQEGTGARGDGLYEKILSCPDGRRRIGGVDGSNDAGAGHGQALERSQTGLPCHRQEESGVAAWSSQGDRDQGKALPPLVTDRQPGASFNVSEVPTISGSPRFVVGSFAGGWLSASTMHQAAGRDGRPNLVLGSCGRHSSERSSAT